MAAAVVLGCALPSVAAAQLPDVNTFTDDAGPAGCTETHCTLRERVEEEPGSDTIRLQAGTYELTRGPLNLDSFMQIEGVDARETTIDASGLSRIGHVTTSTGVTFSQLTVTGGNANTALNQDQGHGGAFRVGFDADLILIDTTLTGNVASATGGAISSLGSVSFVASTASGNNAGSGPTPGQGGALYSAGDAGHIFMLNSTLSGNSAVPGDGPSRGGGIYSDDSLNLQYVTIADNFASIGGGLFQNDPAPGPGFTSMFDTLIAANDGGACGGNVAGLEEDNNVADDDSCSLADSGAEDPDAALLAPLDNYNGPTDTHALYTGNPAIGAARPDFCGGTDQRGAPRTEGGPCNAGAFEGNIDQGARVSTTLDGNDGECDTDCTLREAVSLPDVQVVTVPPGRYELTLGALPITTDKQIIGSGARTTIIDANNEDRVAYVSDGSTLFHEVTLTGGNASVGDPPDVNLGGAVYVGFQAQVAVLRSAVAGNFAGANGGGIYSLGELDVIDSTVSGNVAGNLNTPGLGGGIHSLRLARIQNSTISGNTATGGGQGGGLYLADEFGLDHVTVARNSAAVGGGMQLEGIAIPDELIFLIDTLVAGNTGGACAGDLEMIDDWEGSVADDTSCEIGTDGIVSAAAASIAPLGDRGGQTDTHALFTGNPAIDAANDCEGVDQRGVLRPQNGPCDAGAYEGNIDPPTNPPPPPQGGGGGTSQPPAEEARQELPPPEAGESVNVALKSGTVKVKVKGSSKFVELEEGQQIPLGTEIDTRNGRVTLTAASNTSGGTATADFYDGIFKVLQTSGAKPITRLVLTEKLSCPKTGGKASVAAKKKKKRRLWGDGSGKFRTEGEFSSATVRGTQWLTEDSCKSTLTRVVKGSVSVRDFAKKKTVVVKAGKKHVAKSTR